MSKPEYTIKNIEALAIKIVENLDVKDLMRYVQGDLERQYFEDQDVFFEDWYNHFGESADDSQ